jgi:hypothetical protein
MVQAKGKSTTRLLFFFLLLTNPYFKIYSQGLLNNKPPLDTSVLGKWPTLSQPTISPYGKYVAYCIEMSLPAKNILIIRIQANLGKENIPVILVVVFFRQMNKRHLPGKMTVCIITLGKYKPDQIHIGPPFCMRSSNWVEWIAYGGEVDTDKLILVNVLNGKITKLGKVSSYRFDDQGKTLWISKKSGSASSTRTELWWVDLATRNNSKIWTGKIQDKLVGFNRSDNGLQLSMITSEQWKQRLAFNLVLPNYRRLQRESITGWQ